MTNVRRTLTLLRARTVWWCNIIEDIILVRDICVTFFFVLFFFRFKILYFTHSVTMRSSATRRPLLTYSDTVIITTLFVRVLRSVFFLLVLHITITIIRVTLFPNWRLSGESFDTSNIIGEKKKSDALSYNILRVLCCRCISL